MQWKGGKGEPRAHGGCRGTQQQQPPREQDDEVQQQQQEPQQENEQPMWKMWPARATPTAHGCNSHTRGAWCKR